jgi:hypothetical protein
MSIYLQAQIQSQPGKAGVLANLVLEQIAPFMEIQRWKLVGCYRSKTGPINMLDIWWELPGIEDFQKAQTAFTSSSSFPEFRVLLDEFIQRQTLTFFDKIG